jgi:quercetin dioxygenase-like cupin family protein
MSNMVDIETQPVIDVWGGGAVRARKIDGARATLSVVELAANAVVPGHRHENEQLGMVITGSITFTIGDERRELGPGGTWRIPSDTPHQASVGPAGACCSPGRGLRSHAPLR